ncbi:MAG: hypothetical protein QXV32_07145 [Conexivisphaerales archaeon]
MLSLIDLPVLYAKANLLIGQADLTDIIVIITGIFSLLLATLSIIAWRRRQSIRLMIVAVAFLIFFIKTVIELIPNFTNLLQIISSLLDLVVLAIIFIAVTFQPKQKEDTI